MAERSAAMMQAYMKMLEGIGGGGAAPLNWDIGEVKPMKPMGGDSKLDMSKDPRVNNAGAEAEQMTPEVREAISPTQNALGQQKLAMDLAGPEASPEQGQGNFQKLMSTLGISNNPPEEAPETSNPLDSESLVPRRASMNEESMDKMRRK